MSNPDSNTPSIRALNLAVKPAGYYSWDEFKAEGYAEQDIYTIALAYAELLDKADKVGRMVEVSQVTGLCAEEWEELHPLAKSLILPDPIDPDLLEVEKIAEARANSPLFIPIEETILAALKRGRELAKEQDRG